MSLCIEKESCTACGACAEVCPGGLLSAGGGVCEIDRPADCWGCAACLKACPSQALSLRLAPELGGRGGRLRCQYDGGKLIWLYTSASGALTKISGSGEGGGY
jgi:adenylylsulfate reductase subunit B